MKKTFVKGWWIVIKDNCLLICKRRRNGDYVLPKWHCESNESLEECALREVEEETGYLCTIVDFLAINSYTKDINNNSIESLVHFYVMNIVEHRPESLLHDEVEEVLFIPLTEDWLSILSYENDRDFIEKYILPSTL